jgi:hypothetical protein
MIYTKFLVKSKVSLCLTKHHAMKPHCLIKHHAVKTYWGSGGIAPLILNLCTYMEVSGQLNALDALPTEKEPPVSVG